MRLVEPIEVPRGPLSPITTVSHNLHRGHRNISSPELISQNIREQELYDIPMVRGPARATPIVPTPESIDILLAALQCLPVAVIKY